MSQTNDARAKLQELLRDLFQFDCADLDFGIYRIMNHKRAEIEGFIEKDLLDAVARELDQGVLAGQAQAASQLAEAEQQVKGSLGAEAISPEGELAEQYRTTPLGQRYLELREEAATYHARPVQETLVFNHLVAFFSRYYQDGDFISKRRYSKRERYAIPYNGEEVYLHWANKDQYYVKTGEHFTDYSFKAPGDVTVHFRLQAADVEQDNVTGEKRFFIPLIAKATWEETAREVVIPFEYRPLTDQETIAYGTRDQQQKVIAEALDKLPARLRKHTEAVAGLMAERRRNAQGEPVSCLEHHLRQYTRRNTSDFFIHKDLRGFLERELDFYLKNEVLNLQELLAGDDHRAEGWFQLMQAIRRIGVRIIAFLAQIEDFQKALWEKKKFVLSTEYCMTLDRVPEDFYPEIAANKAQIEEWRRLFRIDEISPTLFHSGGKAKKAKGKGRTAPLDVAFLKAHPTLVLDTKVFDQDFRDRLLASFGDLDAQTGGLLVHGENFQALGLLATRFDGSVACIYLDPPYNTRNKEFLYKDGYRHSTWLAMMDDRFRQARDLLRAGGIVFVSIDENEVDNLVKVLDKSFEERVAIAVVKTNPKGRGQDKYLATSHEYLVAYSLDGMTELSGIPKTDAQLADYRYSDSHGDFRYMELRNTHRQFNRETRHNLWYPLYVNVATGEASLERTEGAEKVLPVWDDGFEGCWGWGRALVRSQSRMLVGRLVNGSWKVYRKDYAKQNGSVATFVPKTIWDDPDMRTEVGQRILDDVLGEQLLRSPKPPALIARAVQLAPHPVGYVMDYFAGSGTTAHAVLNLNAGDSGDRKYILVEMADYFDTILKPRIQKVMFSREWKDGKPTSAEGHSHIFRYQRLESYEDALNNIAFSAAGGQSAMEFEDYLLRYMLDFETRDSETLLNAAKLESPFSYTLLVHRDGGTREQPVDLPETFNYLIGLQVKTRRGYRDGDRRYLVYRGSNQRADVVVIWRDTKGWTQADLDRDKQFILKHKLTEGADEVFVNGDSFIPGAKALDPMFKRLMLGGTN